MWSGRSSCPGVRALTADLISQAADLEARTRKAMAVLPPDRWPHRQERRDELEWIDCLLEGYIEATS